MARIRLPLIDRVRRWPVIRQVAAGRRLKQRYASTTGDRDLAIGGP